MQRTRASRESVTDAAWTVLERDGLEAVTIRSVAREMGVTSGVIGHYFAGKDDLLGVLLDRLFTRLDARFAATLAEQTTLTALRDAVVSILPIDLEMQAIWRVWMRLVGAEATRARFETAQRDYLRVARGSLTGRLADLQRQGALTPSPSAEVMADLLLMLIDGLGVRDFAYGEPVPPSRQAALVDAFMALLTGVGKVPIA